jgi:hypothetical protein
VNNVNPKNTASVIILSKIKSITTLSQRSLTSNLQRLKHNEIIIKRDNNTKRERLHERERRQQDVVRRMAVAFPIEQSKIDQRAKQGDVKRPSADMTVFGLGRSN